MEKEKITIIEGPPPTFEAEQNDWVLGLAESSQFYRLATTRLRTFNGHALVERCHRSWNSRDNIFLHYRDKRGREQKVPIVAARAVDSDDGNVLILWVRLDPEEDEQNFDEDMNGFDDNIDN